MRSERALEDAEWTLPAAPGHRGSALLTPQRASRPSSPLSAALSPQESSQTHQVLSFPKLTPWLGIALNGDGHLDLN